MTNLLSKVLFGVVAALCAAALTQAQGDLDQRIGKEMDSLTTPYKHIHQNPELSTEEKETSALLANELRHRLP